MLKNTFSAIVYEGELTQLLISIYEELNLENSLSLIEKCGDLMNSDFFLFEYKDLFVTKCKEVLIENHIDFNSLIDAKLFEKFFNDDFNKTTNFVVNLLP